MHIYKDHAEAYVKKGFSVIPDKYSSKQPAIKNWTAYCVSKPTMEERAGWYGSFSETNISMCLGRASGIIALDLDCTDPKILALIEHILPESPAEKVGSKGWTRFFRYSGESSQNVRHNGEVVIELLSDNKKTTMPPSIHPNGSAYKWVDESILDIDVADLPLLPPSLIPELEQRIRLHMPETQSTSRGLISGRNNALSSLCGKLISERKPVDTALKELIETDREMHPTPLFTDPEEMMHIEPYTNALQFYCNHLMSVNTKRHRKNEEYEIPITASAVNTAYNESVGLGKSLKAVKSKKSNRVLPSAQGALKDIQDFILANSWIKQKELAFGASLVFMSTLIGRKLIFQGGAPNLYILNVAPSGAGKDAPQQCLKELFVCMKAENLMGASDYVSDASLMDGLAINPVRLDIIDEASGLLKSVNAGGATYNGKMADFLCELYTTSNSKFLGRMTAEGRRGSCYRPNVNLLCSTTPTGLTEGITRTAIEKGLIGRFLIFRGQGDVESKRLERNTYADSDLIRRLQYWTSFKPPVSAAKGMLDISQEVYQVESTPKARVRLDELFKEFDELRRSTKQDSPLLPIISRLFQQMSKIALIHSASRVDTTIPEIDLVDVDFGYKTILYFYDSIQDIVKNHIFENKTEALMVKVFNMIAREGSEGISKTELSSKTRFLNKKQRDEIIIDLSDNERITVTLEQRDGKNRTIFRAVE